MKIPRELWNKAAIFSLTPDMLWDQLKLKDKEKYIFKGAIFDFDTNSFLIKVCSEDFPEKPEAEVHPRLKMIIYPDNQFELEL